MSTKTHTPASPEALAEMPVEAIALESIVSRVTEQEREIRRAEAKQVELFAEAFDLAALSTRAIVRGRDVQVDSSVPGSSEAMVKYRSIRAELALAIGLSEATVARRMVKAWELTHHYWSVFTAYEEGDLSQQHVNIIIDAGRLVGLSEDVETSFRRAEYQAQVLEHARVMSPNRLRPVARQIAEQYAETPLDARHAEARRARRVWVMEAEDGMADLYALLPAVEAYAIHDRLTRMSRTVVDAEAAAARESRSRMTECDDAGDHDHASAEEARRSRDEIRADLFADLLVNGESVETCETGLAGVRGHVQVLMPATVITGSAGNAGCEPLDELLIGFGFPTAPPPVIQGYGPIDSASARELAGDADAWEVIHTGAVMPDNSSPAAESPGKITQEVMSVDRYRPSEQMRRFLRARDQHCRFPGCRVALARCDIDHTVDAALGGVTATDNLAHLCRGHHTVKHHGGWRVRQERGGVLEWTSPSGRAYRDPPPSRVRFTPVEHVTPDDDWLHPF